MVSIIIHCISICVSNAFYDLTSLLNICDLSDLMNAYLLNKYLYAYLIQNSPAVKKSAAHKKAIVKKDVKSKVVAKKWL